MSEKTEKRRAELRTRLVDAAEAAIVADGIAAVKARDLAKQANCAVGAIYNVFADLTQLVMAVNGRTFQRLGQEVEAELAHRTDALPADQLVSIALTYLHFASDNKNTWRALFEVEMSTDQPVPHWYQEQLAGLFGLIRLPLSRLRPDLADEELSLLTRALFSSVHGIVSLGLEKRISGVPVPEMEKMISMIIKHFAGEPSKM